MRSATAAVIMAGVLVACGAETPTPTATPAPSFTQVGDGSVLDSTWAYGVRTEGDEWCTRLEVGDASESRCGDLLPADDDAFGQLSFAEFGDAQTIEGFVTDEAATVWLLGDGYRNPAVLVPLDEVGVDGVQGFVGFAAADVTLTHVMAVKLNGDVLQTVELP